MNQHLTNYGSIKAEHHLIVEKSWWKDLIPDSTELYLNTYVQGEMIFDIKPDKDGKKHVEIPLSPFSNPLAIILSGRAEIYEIYTVYGFFRKKKKGEKGLGLSAYRPIKILREGNIFGDFSILDKCLGLTGVGTEGETWKISAGFKTLWITGDCTKTAQYFHEFQEYSDDEDDDENIHVHRLFDKYISCDTTIAVIDGDSIIKRTDFYHQLLEHSWKGAKMYRECLNSFNYRKKIEFMKSAEKVLNTFASIKYKKQNKKNSDKTDRKQIIPLFVDAIWDACNRPSRLEPMFAKCHLPYIESFDINTVGLMNSEILSATDNFDEFPLLFPVDLTNYILASHFEENGEIAQTFGSLINNDNDDECKPYEFYMKLANSLLEEYNNSGEYNYHVKCLPVKGLGRNHLALEFEKKR